MAGPVVRIALRPFAGVEFEDRSPEQNGGIFICNHRSASDPFLVSSVAVRRAPAQVVNRWPMRLPFFGFFAGIGEYLDITSMNYEQAKERAAYLLGQHVPLFVFPEGTRSGSREMNQFHGTFFRIAKELSCPLIPVAITAMTDTVAGTTVSRAAESASENCLPSQWKSLQSCLPFN